jgi:hypothetical protein
MAIYKVQFICDECGDTHAIPGLYNLGGGPATKASICEAYKEGGVPPAINRLHRTKFTCPLTGRKTRQADDGQIFLIPIAD